MEWTRYNSSELPPENTRILVSDSEHIAIAYYVTYDDSIVWFFDNRAYHEMKIVWWTNLPTLPPKVVTNNENNN